MGKNMLSQAVNGNNIAVANDNREEQSYQPLLFDEKTWHDLKDDFLTRLLRDLGLDC